MSERVSEKEREKIRTKATNSAEQQHNRCRVMSFSFSFNSFESIRGRSAPPNPCNCPKLVH